MEKKKTSIGIKRVCVTKKSVSTANAGMEEEYS